MKLLSLIPTPQHVVTAEINNRTQGQVIDITVYNETKSFRAVSVADNEVEKTDGRSFGRSSNTFWAAMYNGKEILLFVQGTGADRKIVRIDTELEQLKRLLRTSVNDYPQGKFLFNMDKARVFYPGYNWLYNLTKREISKLAHTTPLADIIDNYPTQSFKGMFPLLNKSIPPRIQKGLFFTENEEFWRREKRVKVKPNWEIIRLKEDRAKLQTELKTLDRLIIQKADEFADACVMVKGLISTQKVWCNTTGYPDPRTKVKLDKWNKTKRSLQKEYECLQNSRTAMTRLSCKLHLECLSIRLKERT